MNDLQPIGDLQHPVVRRETCSLATVRRIAAMLDQDPDKWSEGDLLPRGWQFILLGADTKRSELREDGFPGLGVSLPDLGLSRLMLGGRTVHYNGDIRIGAVLRRESQIQKLTPQGNGERPHGFRNGGARPSCRRGTGSHPCGDAKLYPLGRQAEQPESADSAAGDAVRHHQAHRARRDVAVSVFRALDLTPTRFISIETFARETEGFPDLVVNGGLATLLLTEFLRLELKGAFTSLTAKHVAPLFRGRPISLWGERQNDTWLLRAFDDNGLLAVDIEARP